MKLKEIERTAVQAWSPSNHHPVYLATGTSAQQLDASFSTNATLEIFEVDFRDPSLDMKQKGTLPASNRFHKLIWGNFGNGSPESSGVIIGGGDNGVLTMYSVHHILASKSEPVIGRTEKHSGPVRALDFNPFQSNLLASGANDSEIFIWDLNNFSVPMTPGAKSQPHEDISVVSWNRQVQHILSSAHPSGKAVVWDLRKNEPIIKVSDHSNRMHCSGMAWHPEVATQLVLSSEDDRLPVIQIWDLRFATSPLSQLEGHTRGVLSVSWCQADPELLLSSAKDNRILCWNPSMGEVVYELPIRSQWCFDVQWCPRNPSVFSAATFDGWINIYSVMGGNLEAQQKTQADKISSSFNNLDPFGTGQILPPLQVPEQVAQTTLIPPLKKPPKWIRRPVGVSFAFGGKLISFGLAKAPGQQMQQTYPHQVFISQVTTETEFLLRSRELQMALQSGNLLDYCQGKIQTAKLPFDENLWNFLKVNLEQESRTKLLKLLGYSKEDLQKKVRGPSIREKLLQDKSCCRRAVKSLLEMTELTLLLTSVDTDGLISQALLLGNFEAAVELCMRAERFADAIILAIAGGEDLLKETQKRYFAKRKTKLSLLLSSVVQQNWQDIVCTCDLQSWKEALAILLTYSKHEDYTHLCDMLGARLESEGDAALSNDACLCYISSGNVERLVECWVKNHETSSPLALQDLIEKVMVLSRSIEILQGTAGHAPGPVLAERITQYASLLASQGCLAAAMNYLPSSSKEVSEKQVVESLCFDMNHDLRFHLNYGNLRVEVCWVFFLGHSFCLHLLFLCSAFGSGKMKRAILPEKFTPPAPITAPVMSLPTETQGIHPQLSRLQESGQSPPGYSLGFQRGEILSGHSCRSGIYLLQPSMLLLHSFSCFSLCQYHQLPMERVERKEVPPEHQALKATFEELVQRCSAVATDPKTRRKLEDALQRLECLYEKLREQTLSPTILMGLHEIAHCVEARNYQQGLLVHTQVVSSSSFSEVSGFMPILKVLMTIAGKLNV
uniref:Protein transport protein Sec31A n=1 Tax=Athene cunicularia TaxID=194338 RepID=A0A663LUX4_ATHCN